MKVVIAVILFLMFQAAPGQAEEHRLDLLARVLDPLLAPFVKQTPNPNRSLDAELSLIAMTGVPPELIGTKVHFAVEYPNKIYLHGPVLGRQLTLCRNEKELWVFPGERARPLVEQYAGSAPEPKKKVRLGDLELPFTQAQLIFLPALFQVKEYAAEMVNGVSCRILELNLLPEIGRSLGVESWQARLWVGPNYKLTKLEILKPGWHLLVGVDRISFQPTLPKTTWQPTPEEAGDVMRLKDYQLKRLMDAVAENFQAEIPSITGIHPFVNG